jgi:membrane associated rhomboid family serine protease
MLTAMSFVWRLLGWLMLALAAMVIGFAIGASAFDCPEDAADCDLGILDAYAGAFAGLLVAALVAFVVEVTLLARRLARRRSGVPTG